MSKDLKTIISIIGFGCAGLCILGVVVAVFAGSTLFEGFLDEADRVEIPPVIAGNVSFIIKIFKLSHEFAIMYGCMFS